MDTNMTVDPRFVQVVLDVKGGDFDKFFLGRLDAYIRRQQGNGFAFSPQQDAQREQMLEAARGEYERVNATPPPLSGADDYSKLPDGTQDLIRKKSEILGHMLTDAFPLANGESLASTEVKVLMAPWERFDAGMVVYLQETDLGTVAFFLPYLKLDAQDASLNTIRGTYVLTTKINPQATLSYVQNRRVLKAGAVAVAGVDPGKALLTFATVAAFALPEPFGVLISGALSVVQMFFGGSSADPFKDAMQALFQNIQAYMEYEQIKTSANTIKSALQWMNTNSTVIQDLGTDKAAHDYIVGNRMTQVPGALAQISSEYGPNSPLLDALNTLHDVHLSDDHDWDLRMNAFDALVMGVAAYVTFLRVRVQMQAALETEKGYKGSQQMYGYYDAFRIETLFWATQLAQRIDELQNERVNMVGALQRGEDYQFCMDEVSCSLAAATDGYWTFTDNEPGTGNQGKWQDTADMKSSCGQIYYDSVQHQDQATAARNAYIQRLNEGMDQRFAGAKEMIQGFQDAIDTWNESLTPRVPQSAPGVNSDPSTWHGDTPQGANWVNGAKVRYAVTFANAAGVGPQGPWGSWTGVTTKAWPTVVNLPTDPLGLATVRQLHRQFTLPDGTTGPDEIVTIIADNQTTTYQDVNN